jgi:hypothetical protein
MSKIVGLSGVAGCGKSFVANLLENQGFVPIAFADPIKRIVQDIFDFSYNQLWGPSEERNKPDTRYWRLPVSKEILDQRNQQYNDLWTANFAGASEGSVVLGLPPRQDVLKLTDEQLRCYDEDNGYLTPRVALQQLGTEYGRNCYSSIWIDYTFRSIKKIVASPDYAREHRCGVVISDVRFRNEFEAVKKNGGVNIRIVRDKATTLKSGGASHQSEKEQKLMKDSEFDFVFHNVENEEEMKKNFAEMIKKIG